VPRPVTRAGRGLSDSTLTEEKLQPSQPISPDAKLRAQVPNEGRVAKGVVRLPRANNHSLHLVDEALHDDGAVLLILEGCEVEGEFASQLECVAGLAPCHPCRF
jgi:hypothetical protein